MKLLYLYLLKIYLRLYWKNQLNNLWIHPRGTIPFCPSGHNIISRVNLTLLQTEANTKDFWSTGIHSSTGAYTLLINTLYTVHCTLYTTLYCIYPLFILFWEIYTTLPVSYKTFPLYNILSQMMFLNVIWPASETLDSELRHMYTCIVN